MSDDLSHVPTPRTDEAAHICANGAYQKKPSDYVSGDFARQLERELADADAVIKDADDDCAAHNLYTVEESLRAARAIAEFNGEDPERHFASMHDRIWFTEMARELERLRVALKAAQESQR